MTHQWTGKEVKAFRKHLKLGQLAFAALIGAGSVKTVADWENKKRQPSGSYCQVLDMVAMENDYNPKSQKNNERENQK